MSGAVITFQDSIDHLVDYLGAGPGDAVIRDSRRAVLEAYRDLTNAHRWSYLYAHGRVICVPPFQDGTIAYDHAGGQYERMVTLSGAAWPSWAEGAYVRVGMAGYRVVRRVSATVLVLDEQVNPGADLDAGTEFTLYRDTYVLPEDFVAQDQALYERNFGGMDYVHPREWLYESRYVFAQGQPQWFTVVGDTVYPGRLTMKVCPFPTDARSIDFVYQRRPRPLAISSEARGTASVTVGSNVVTGVGTAFTPAMVGSIVRLSGVAGKAPTSLIDANPAAFESVVRSVASATSLAVADAADAALSGAKLIVSDPVDIEVGAMGNAWYRCLEKCIAQNRTLKDKPSALAQYQKQLTEAREADSRSFQGRAAGPALRYRQRLRDMPAGADDIN